jgi:hypothetical protein
MRFIWTIMVLILVLPNAAFQLVVPVGVVVDPEVVLVVLVVLVEWEALILRLR